MAFTNVNTATYWGKTGIPALTTAIDANFALLEAGGAGAVSGFFRRGRRRRGRGYRFSPRGGSGGNGEPG